MVISVDTAAGAMLYFAISSDSNLAVIFYFSLPSRSPQGTQRGPHDHEEESCVITK
jgi:hypothetical protein